MPDFAPNEYRALAAAALERTDRRLRLDALAVVATDQALKIKAVKKNKNEESSDDENDTSTHTAASKRVVVYATPLCLLSGQGHQDILPRMATIDTGAQSNARRAGKSARTKKNDLEAALFQAWERGDTSTFSFRWDPEEAARQALMAGDPTDKAFKLGTEKGANRLAAIGLSVLPVVAGAQDRALVPGFWARDEGPTFHWPIWRAPVSLAAVRAMLAHPGIAEPGGLARLGVETVMRAPIEAIGQYKHVGRAGPLLRDQRG